MSRLRRPPALPPRARRLVRTAAYGGGGAGLAGGFLAGVFWAEAKVARRTVGVPTSTPPDPAGLYRAGPGEPLCLAVLGDSSAAGLGVDRPEETPAAYLADGLAALSGRPVLLDVVAVSGAKSADLDAQVTRALSRPVDVALVLIGANDVTHRVPVRDAADALAAAVRRLQEAGVATLVGTCPDLGTVKPIPQPLRTVARVWSRRLAAAQTVSVVENGGRTLSLGDLLGPAFASEPDLWHTDRFHPSAAGYARLAAALLPALAELAGHGVAGEQVVDVVETVEAAALAAARDPGLEVETIPGAGGAAQGPGRLARLRRRLPGLPPLPPLPGRGGPRPTDAADPADPADPDGAAAPAAASGEAG